MLIERGLDTGWKEQVIRTVEEVVRVANKWHETPDGLPVDFQELQNGLLDKKELLTMLRKYNEQIPALRQRVLKLVRQLDARQDGINLQNLISLLLHNYYRGKLGIAINEL